jgi:hypothetical protein
MTLDLVLAAAGHAEPPPIWLLALIPVFLVGMWVLVTTLLGFMAGHSLLLSRYPPVEERCEQSFGSASGRMRAVTFRGALHVGIGPRGLHIAASWPFRPAFRRGIPCVPWREIRLVSSSPGGFLGLFKGTTFEIPSIGLGFSLRGDAAKAVERKLATGDAGPDLPPMRSPVR